MENCRPNNKKMMLTFGYMLLLLASSAIPMDRNIRGLRFIIDLKPDVQNLLHIPMFAILAILILQFLENFKIGGWRRNALVLLSAGVFGIINEFIQIAVPGRYGGLSDIGLNFIGTMAGLLIYSIVEKIVRFNKTNCG